MRSWSEAWADALYGPSGFFLREAPLDHFRTNVAVPLFATAVRRLAGLVDAALGFPDPFDVVDLGAGRGELLDGLAEVPARWRLTGVDLASPADRRTGAEVAWSDEVPEVHGLLIANEWLDSIPLDVVEDGRLVLVADDGTETLGAPLSSEWASQWWPQPGVEQSPHQDRGSSPHRVEVGAPRDLAWAAAVARVRRGMAVAIDYGHTVADRRPSLSGYCQGRQVLPVPDGTCDLTAHVALDSAASATGSRLVTQREALRSLGISATLPTIGDPQRSVGSPNDALGIPNGP
ncbi:MAG: SAM-dependent methyltransferase, partial [Actinomycetota bacterium]|nr:SAM-dependent methyltransferase [Actinomycetota bacterium]